MPKENFEEVAVLTDKDNLVQCVITRRVDTRVKWFAVSFQREFEKGGKTERTFWLPKRVLYALQSLLPQVIERMELEEDKTRAEERRGQKAVELRAPMSSMARVRS